jgi:hypothetical protein
MEYRYFENVSSPETQGILVTYAARGVVKEA